MAKQRNALKSGIFILLCLALAAAVAVAIKGAGGIFDPHRTRAVAFKLQDDIGGLQVGNDVRIGGFKVGTVRRIHVAQADAAGATRIIVDFSMPRRYVLREKASIRIQTGFTGSSVLNIESLGNGPALADDEPLVGLPSHMNQMMADAGGLVGDIRNKTLPTLNADLSKFGNMAESITKAGDAGKQMMTQVGDVFGESKGDIKGTLANLREATGTVKDKLPKVLENVGSAFAKVDTALNQANLALEDIRKSADNIREITATGRSIMVGNKGKIDTMVASLKTTSENMKGASVEIRRSPWRLLYNPDEKDRGNLELFSAARQFAQGAGDLNDAAQALRDALKDDHADKVRLNRLMEDLDKKFGEFRHVEDSLWNRVKE